MKTYTDDALARAIYKIADARMQAAGEKMPCSENVFAVTAAAAPDAVQYAELAALENPDFLAAAYLRLLGRPVDPEAGKVWQSSLDLPQLEFQTQVLKTIVRSPEYQKIRIPLYGCPLPLSDEQQGNLLISAQAMPERLVRIYQKMPLPLRKLAKKIAGKE